MSYSPQRILLQGTPVSPKELLYGELGTPENVDYLVALQRWLGMDPVSGVWDTETQQNLTQFREQKGLTQDPDKVSVEVWDALEAYFWSHDPRSREKQYHAAVTEKATLPQELIESLLTIGVRVPNEEKLPDGVQLFKVLLRRIHRFETVKSGNPYLLYPTLREPYIQVSSPVWRGFRSTWLNLSGAPWLGYVCEPQPKSVHWATEELSKVIRKTGEHYLQELADQTSLSEALDQPIQIAYTGYALGGRIAERDDFSQIGLNASLSLPDWSHTAVIKALGMALNKAHPAWRIRYTADPKGPAEWPWYPVEEQLNSPVLEMDPDFEKLIYTPGRAPVLLEKKPDLLNRFSTELIATELSARIQSVTAVEMEAFFEGIRDKMPQEILGLLVAMRQAKGLSTLLEIIHERGADFLDVLLGVNLTGLPISGLSEKMRQWQQVIIDLLYVWRLTTDFSEAFSAEAIISKAKYYSNHNPFD